MNTTGSKFRRFVASVNDPNAIGVATAVAVLLLISDGILTAGILVKVPYTEIDWVAYMEQVELINQGERDYANIKGGTGPLVYPAGHVLLYRGLHALTGGGSIPDAQRLFAVLYIATQALVMVLYIRSRALPPWSLTLLCLSKRVHSIYVLRCFNDCLAMFVAYLATWMLQRRAWRGAVLAFSAAVSVKMNVLLMAPPVLMVLLQAATLQDIVAGGLAGVALQVALAAPFLTAAPSSYLGRAFEFSRVFFFKWTVNLKFLPEALFLSKRLAAGLLAAHLLLLALLAATKWCSGGGKAGLPRVLQRCWHRSFGPAVGGAKRSGSSAVRGGGGRGTTSHGGGSSTAHSSGSAGGVGVSDGDGDGHVLSRYVLYVVFSGNLVGVVCARSLHYQFYCWYFHTIPFLLWHAALPTAARLALWLGIEVCWNVYPARPWSSLLLLGCHLALLAGLLAAQPPLPPRSGSKPASLQD